jgi:hypothetical protein
VLFRCLQYAVLSYISVLLVLIYFIDFCCESAFYNFGFLQSWLDGIGVVISLFLFFKSA